MPRKKNKSARSTKIAKIFVAVSSVFIAAFLFLLIDGIYKSDRSVAKIDAALNAGGLSADSLDSEKTVLKLAGAKIYKFTERVYFVGDEQLLDATLALAGLENKSGINVFSQTNADESNHTFKITAGDLPILKIRLLAKKHRKPVKKTDGVASGKAALIAIVIDDVGSEWKCTSRLLAIDGDITFAVMPSGDNRERARSEIKRRGREVMLHLPMEPIGKTKLKYMGPTGLFEDMTAEEIRAKTELNLDNLPEAIGVNNHMGSRFTRSAAGMNAVLDVLKKRNLFFIDSVTTPDSIAYELAVKYGVRAWDRDVFLDTRNNKAAVVRQLKKLISIAKKNGKAIAIGHPRQGTVEALESEIPKLEKYGVKLVRASAIVE